MPREFKITDARHGAAFTVRVVTRAKQVEIVGLQDDGALRVRLTEEPTDGRADAQLIAVLAEVLEVDAAQIEIVAGRDQPNKIVSVQGVSPAWIESHLAAWY